MPRYFFDTSLLSISTGWRRLIISFVPAREVIAELHRKYNLAELP
jgi:hypothetical protein